MGISHANPPSGRDARGAVGGLLLPTVRAGPVLLVLLEQPVPTLAVRANPLEVVPRVTRLRGLHLICH
jgi:hypothetical protein